MKRCCQNIDRLRWASLGSLLVLFFFMVTAQALAGTLDGQPAPAFTLRDQEGQACNLDDFAGRPVLLKIGTTWCPSCAGQSGEIAKALPELQTLGVEVVEVFVEDTAEAVSDYRAQHHVPQGVRTCLDQDGQVLSDYRVTAIPRVLFLDAKHRVIKDQYLVPAVGMVKAFAAVSVEK